MNSMVPGAERTDEYRALINKLEYARHRESQTRKRYQIIACPAWEELAIGMERAYPERFHYHKTSWGKFPDGTDNIEVGGYTPHNVIAGERVMFLASFHNNDVTLSQFQVLVMLLQSFIEELVVVLPFYPVGTMERTVKEGQVATANTYAQMFSNLPSCGRPTRLIIYDLHTLQNRFYLHGNVIGSLKTTIPLLLPYLEKHNINCIAFPDDGAAKRFAHMFEHLGLDVVTCGKTRDGDARVVAIQDGDPEGKNIIIVDDLVQTGGTLYECGMELLARGASEVSAFVAHGVFPQDA
uniref:Phosphoribosyltransferase domain-containing protein n=1 Tax=Octactis speculum TaxID=3111310 RepID=A0A7S2DHP0_9STRA